jgi:hypothetical protein
VSTGPDCRVIVALSLLLWMIIGGALQPSAQTEATTVILMEANPVDLMITCRQPLTKSTVCVRASSKYTAVSSMHNVFAKFKYWRRPFTTFHMHERVSNAKELHDNQQQC